MNPTGLNTEIESVLLTTLVTLMPTNARWLRRIRFLLLMALLIRAWMNQQTQLEMGTSAAGAGTFTSGQPATSDAGGDNGNGTSRKRTSRRKTTNA